MSRLESLISQLDPQLLPRHVAMIMDGNGRWARMRGRQRGEGHAEGITTVRRVTELSSDLGIGYLTLYAFSTENWNRPQEEVDTLMYLIGWAIERELPDLIRNNVRIHLIGDIERVPEEARLKLTGSRDKTAHCTGLNLGICISYSARWEITRAARHLAEEVLKGNLAPSDIDESEIARNLATYPFPDPDLLIRTGGEKRISNFLLWQIAYSELYFTDLLWPDFGKEEYAEALLHYQQRERRFGKTSEQIANE
ncbi:MAG: isoprenyl transferase [Muribaculaceae bacterium]|nr:isoprenyl transferase [Muribaculaceae bacterium]